MGHVAAEHEAEISEADDTHEEDSTARMVSQKKSHGKNSFLFCVVIFSNILSFAALAVAIACILLWTFEVKGYMSQLQSVIEMLNDSNVSFCTVM